LGKNLNFQSKKLKIAPELHPFGRGRPEGRRGSPLEGVPGRFGKIIRSVIGGSGPVFKDRYHVHVLKTPAEMKRALEYVLLNTAKHMKVFEHIDNFSLGICLPRVA